MPAALKHDEKVRMDALALQLKWESVRWTDAEIRHAIATLQERLAWREAVKARQAAWTAEEILRNEG